MSPPTPRSCSEPPFSTPTGFLLSPVITKPGSLGLGSISVLCPDRILCLLLPRSICLPWFLLCVPGSASFFSWRCLKKVTGWSSVSFRSVSAPVCPETALRLPASAVQPRSAVLSVLLLKFSPATLTPALPTAGCTGMTLWPFAPGPLDREPGPWLRHFSRVSSLLLGGIAQL